MFIWSLYIFLSTIPILYITMLYTQNMLLITIILRQAAAQTGFWCQVIACPQILIWIRPE